MISIGQYYLLIYNESVSSSCPPNIRPSQMIMTDGCGFINLHAMHLLYKKLGLWKEVPMAIQCRVAGAKVLLFILYNIFYKVKPFFSRDCCFYILAGWKTA